MIWRLGWNGVLFSEAGVLINRCYRCKSCSTLDIEAGILHACWRDSSDVEIWVIYHVVIDKFKLFSNAIQPAFTRH